MTDAFDLGVVVPLYNKRATVRRSVMRLLEQTVRPAQIVVVDDGSDDDSASELAGLDERCTLVRQANAGPSAARNRGVRRLRTEWVGFADADNLWSVDRVQRIRDFLAGHPEIDWLVGAYTICAPDGRRIAAPSRQGADGTFTYFDRAPALAGLACVETIVVRRGLLDEAGGFNERLRCYEITHLHLQLAARRPVVGFLAGPTAEVFVDTPSSLYAERRQSPTALRVYVEELLALRGRLSAPPPAYVDRLIADHVHECVSFACRDGEYAVAREMMRRHGQWLTRRARAKASLRCGLAALRGR
jgi:hypothetical protein